MPLIGVGRWVDLIVLGIGCLVNFLLAGVTIIILLKGFSWQISSLELGFWLSIFLIWWLFFALWSFRGIDEYYDIVVYSFHSPVILLLS